MPICPMPKALAASKSLDMDTCNGYIELFSTYLFQ